MGNCNKTIKKMENRTNIDNSKKSPSKKLFFEEKLAVKNKIIESY